MSTKKQIIDYATHTPENVNSNVLSSMLDGLGGGASSWTDLTGKPFDNVGSGLKVEDKNLKLDESFIPTFTAGEGINIDENNVISATGGSDVMVVNFEYGQEEVDPPFISVIADKTFEEVKEHLDNGGLAVATFFDGDEFLQLSNYTEDVIGFIIFHYGTLPEYLSLSLLSDGTFVGVRTKISPYMDLGENIEIVGSSENPFELVINAVDTKYTAGENISIDENNVISATGGSSETVVVNFTITDDPLEIIPFEMKTYLKSDISFEQVVEYINQGKTVVANIEDIGIKIPFVEKTEYEVRFAYNSYNYGPYLVTISLADEDITEHGANSIYIMTSLLSVNSDWNAEEGESGFISNKPFGVLLEPEVMYEDVELEWDEYQSESFDANIYLAIRMPTLDVYDKIISTNDLSINYLGTEYLLNHYVTYNGYENDYLYNMEVYMTEEGHENYRITGYPAFLFGINTAYGLPQIMIFGILNEKIGNNITIDSIKLNGLKSKLNKDSVNLKMSEINNNPFDLLSLNGGTIEIPHMEDNVYYFEAGSGFLNGASTISFKYNGKIYEEKVMYGQSEGDGNWAMCEINALERTPISYPAILVLDVDSLETNCIIVYEDPEKEVADSVTIEDFTININRLPAHCLFIDELTLTFDGSGSGNHTLLKVNKIIDYVPYTSQTDYPTATEFNNLITALRESGIMKDENE